MSDIQPKQYTLKTGESVIVRTARPDDAAKLLEIDVSVAREGEYLLREADEIELDEAVERKRIQTYGMFQKMVCISETGKDGRRGWKIGRLEDWKVGRLLSPILPSRRIEPVEIFHPSIFPCKVSTYFFGNLKHARLYKKLGFQEEGRCPKGTKLASGESIDHVLMYRFVK